MHQHEGVRDSLQRFFNRLNKQPQKKHSPVLLHWSGTDQHISERLWEVHLLAYAPADPLPGTQPFPSAGTIISPLQFPACLAELCLCLC
jgi:hypothetical protein